MEIRKALPSDAAELLKIYAPYVEKTAITFEYEVPSIEEFTRRIETISAKYPYYVAIDDNGTILGYCYAATFKGRAAYDWAVETTIYIKEGLHKTGIGKLLYSKLEESLKKMGITNMNACIGVPEEVEDEYLTFNSRDFHAHLGYTTIAEFHKIGYKFGRWYTGIWMEKIINEHLADMPPVKFGQY